MPLVSKVGRFIARVRVKCSSERIANGKWRRSPPRVDNPGPGSRGRTGDRRPALSIQRSGRGMNRSAECSPLHRESCPTPRGSRYRVSPSEGRRKQQFVLAAQTDRRFHHWLPEGGPMPCERPRGGGSHHHLPARGSLTNPGHPPCLSFSGLHTSKRSLSTQRDQAVDPCFLGCAGRSCSWPAARFSQVPPIARQAA